MTSMLSGTHLEVQYPAHGRVYIPGDPYGKRAPQIAKRGKHAHLHPHPKDKTYAELIVDVLTGQSWEPIVEKRAPIWVRIVAGFVRPESHFLVDGVSLSAEGRSWIEPTKKPDTDNISKIILDTFTHNGVWPDDAQVTRNVQEKVWADAPGVLVEWGVRTS